MDANATRVCLITADPQRAYKDIVAHPSFPKELGAKIARVIGIAKLKGMPNDTVGFGIPTDIN